jgi:hypothetical protein
VDRKTGRTVSFDPKTLIKNIRLDGEIEWHGFLYQAIWRDGRVHLMGSSRILGWDPATNKLEPLFDLPWNARCVRPVATAEHVILGQTALIGKDFSGTMVAVARSGCAQSPTPGAGLLLFGPHMCACTTHFDGFLAMSPRSMPGPVAEADRLLRPAAGGSASPAAVDPPVSPVAELWTDFTISTSGTTGTVHGAGWVLSIDPLRQRVDATGPGGKSWAWVGDARLGTAAVISGGVAVVGSHDGWVTGLELASGAVRWRYLAAPAQRLAIANGLLTSTWPVFGVADLGGGTVVASAGTHPELAGGVRVVALRSADGGLVWQKTITKKPIAIPAGGRASALLTVRSSMRRRRSRMDASSLRPIRPSRRRTPIISAGSNSPPTKTRMPSRSGSAVHRSAGVDDSTRRHPTNGRPGTGGQTG